MSITEKPTGYNIGIVGATGIVGRKMVSVLEEYGVNIQNLFLFSSEKSKDKTIRFKGVELPVQVLSKDIVNLKLDFCLFAVPKKIAKEYVSLLSKEKVYCIDNSSEFRMDPNSLLIIPEVNKSLLSKDSYIISNPNCSTIECVLPLKPLLKLTKIKRIDFTTFQAISGEGKKALDNFRKSFFKKVTPQIDEFSDFDYTLEEWKMINETKRILDLDNVEVSATCVRVPLENCHSASITVELIEEINLNKFREELINTRGIILLDNPKDNIYPTNLDADGTDFVFVGRIRKDVSNKRIIHFFVVSDNIRRGAASNAVLILIQLIKKLEANNV